VSQGAKCGADGPALENCCVNNSGSTMYPIRKEKMVPLTVHGAASAGDLHAAMHTAHGPDATQVCLALDLF
jgi:hypothetical protein